MVTEWTLQWDCFANGCFQGQEWILNDFFPPFLSSSSPCSPLQGVLIPSLETADLDHNSLKSQLKTTKLWGGNLVEPNLTYWVAGKTMCCVYIRHVRAKHILWNKRDWATARKLSSRVLIFRYSPRNLLHIQQCHYLNHGLLTKWHCKNISEHQSRQLGWQTCTGISKWNKIMTKNSSKNSLDVGRWNEIEVICHLFVWLLRNVETRL